LAQNANVEILVKTLSSAEAVRKDCPKENEKVGQDESFRRMGNRAILVVFARDGASVAVHISDSLRRDGVTADKVRKCLQDRLRQRQYDKALEESIKLVREIARAK
jgi:hypothetical protein